MFPKCTSLASVSLQLWLPSMTAWVPWFPTPRWPVKERPFHDPCPGSQNKARSSHTPPTNTQPAQNTVGHTTHTLLLISYVCGQVKVPLVKCSYTHLFLCHDASFLKARINTAAIPESLLLEMSSTRVHTQRKYSVSAEWSP